jgi:hypothetical protein
MSEFNSTKAVEMLIKHLVAEREAHGLNGFWIDHGGTQIFECKNDCRKFREACGRVVESARAQRAGVDVFQTEKGQIGCWIRKGGN